MQADVVGASPGTRVLTEDAAHRRLDHAGIVVDALMHRRGAGRIALTGQIVLRDGRALTGVAVTLHLDGGPVARTTTDAFGEFDFGERPEGRVGLRIDREGRSLCVDLGRGGGQ